MDAAEFAEDAMAYLPLSPSAQRRRLDAGTLSFQPGGAPMFANVSAVRAGDADGLRALADDAAAWFASRGRASFAWFLGPSTTPHDAVERLLAAGATPLAPAARAMVLDSQPAAGAAAEIREVDSAERLLQMRRLLAPAAGGLTERLGAELAVTNDDAWADLQAQGGTRRSFLAFAPDDLDEPVAAATMLLTDVGVVALSGGATAPQAQGRGFYRALVRARWDAAREAGYERLTTQASRESAPILAALGFREVGELTVLGQQIG